MYVGIDEPRQDGCPLEVDGSNAHRNGSAGGRPRGCDLVTGDQDGRVGDGGGTGPVDQIPVNQGEGYRQ